MSLARLAALHGVATAYAPSPGVDVPVPDETVVSVLGALGVDASSPSAVAEALHRAESAAAARLLPPTVVLWTGWDGSAPESRPTASAAAGLPATELSAPRIPGAPIPAALIPAALIPAALTALPPSTTLRVETEQGEVMALPPVPSDAPAPGVTAAGPAAPGPTWATLPLGVHRLAAEAPDGRSGRAVFVVAPAGVPQPPSRTHGFLVQLYSLLSSRSWGMGDLGDLAELAGWSGRSFGAGFVQINPLHAAVPGAPTDPSPYRPSSRRFPDPVHLRIEAIPGFAYARGPERERLDVLVAKAAALRASVLDKSALIDRDAVWELKREALTILDTIPDGPGRHADYTDFLAGQGQALEDHATWYALAEVHGSEWHDWPEGLRDPRSPETAAARRDLLARVEFHRRLAWLTDQQLAAAQQAARDAGMAVGIVHDLAVGVHPGGADAWAQQAAFAPGMSVGAPPDAFNSLGQDWGLPPWRPDVLAASGYAPYRGLLKGLLRHAGALRIDHVMGLFRLWWVPEGQDPTRGTYVRYDSEAMLAVLALEAHRADAVVIGEDLGTVEPGVREALRRRGVLGTSVLWFERDWEGTGHPLPPESWREGCVATATTHDLPSTAARLTGEHVELRHRLGLLTRPLELEQSEEHAEVAAWLSSLTRLGLLPRGGDEEEQIRAVYRFLLRTPARMIGIWLPDAVGDRRPQNLPGTWDQYPNWRLPVADAEGRPVTLEELAASSRSRGLLDVLTGRSVPPRARRT